MVNVWGWQFWLLVLLLIIFFLWLIWGGKKHQFVGLAPLDPNYPLERLGPIPNISYHQPSRRYDDKDYDDKDYDDKDYDDKDYDDEEDDGDTYDHHRTPIAVAKDLHRSQERVRDLRQHSSGLRNHSLDPVINSTPEIPEEVVQKAQTLKYRPVYPQHLKRKKHRSKVEAYCCEIMEEIYGVPFNTTNPDFLRNPETGRKLEIDCYNEDLKIGLEYNGPTHYLWPNYTTQTKEEFVKQIRRDQYKVDACDANGVYLITVPYNVPNEMLKSFIEYYLPENVNQRLYGDRPAAETATCQI
jgi:hypothetical protein